MMPEEIKQKAMYISIIVILYVCYLEFVSA